eukprot:c24394_g1_i1 orf=30-1916(-)
MASCRRRKTVETVETRGALCCISWPLPYKNTPTEASKLYKKSHKPEEKRTQHRCGDERLKASPTQRTTTTLVLNKLEMLKKSREFEKGAGELLQNGEITALLKQGFISAGTVDKVDNGSPFRSFLSSGGRISPMVDVSTLSLSSASAQNLDSLNTGEFSQASPPLDMKKPTPTLYDMMVHEQKMHDRASNHRYMHAHRFKDLLTQEKALSAFSHHGTLLNDPSSCDLKLTLKNKEGFSITISAHSQILATHSRFFAAKLVKILSKQSCQLPHLVEITGCEDIEIYIETLQLMYSQDMKRTLVKETVNRVLKILKVCVGINFEAGIFSCLEYLEAMPWAEEDEPKVTSMLSELHLESIKGADKVLQRLSTDDPTRSEDVLVSLMNLVTKGNNEKARREMKGLVSRMLRENTAHGHEADDLSKDSLYESSHACVNSLVDLFTKASSPGFAGKFSEERVMLTAQIMRQADNLNWLVDIMIDRQIADEFVRIWAFQAELVALHQQVPVVVGRYEVNRITARLCVALGKGQVLAPKEVRYALLHNWLPSLIDDFGWMQRACKGLDTNVVEEGICQTILTLPLKQQQIIMIAWFDKFLKNGDNCPNLQRAFEVWWRRTFTRPSVELVLSSDVHS